MLFINKSHRWEEMTGKKTEMLGPKKTPEVHYIYNSPLRREVLGEKRGEFFSKASKTLQFSPVGKKS